MITGIAVTAYAVRDARRAAAFYRDVLGLADGETFNDAYIEFDVGSGTFAVDADPPGYEPGSCSGVSFEVDDIDAMCVRLRDHGVDVTEIYDFPVCRVAFAKDPDGNRFALHQKSKR